MATYFDQSSAGETLMTCGVSLRGDSVVDGTVQRRKIMGRPSWQFSFGVDIWRQAASEDLERLVPELV
jgi:hypothetical protein